jgi:acetylornithine deacetylase
MTDVVSLARTLLSVDSTTGHEGAVAALVAEWLETRGWQVVRQEVEPGRPNIWATRRGHGVTLSTHLDTVPPFIPPSLDGVRLAGRGSADAKGIAAAMMVAAERLAAQGEERVDLLFVVGEEKGSPGALAANQLPATSRWLVNGEPTESRLASGCKGAQRLHVHVTGREAHSAYPQLGESAIERLVDLLTDLRAVALPSDPILGATTYNVGLVRGGNAANVIAGHAEAELLIRLVGDVGVVREAFERWAEGRARLTWGAHIPAQHFAVLDGLPHAPVAYTSDIPLLDRWGTPLLFGPGSIHVAHTPHEFVDVEELEASVDAYVRIVTTLLGRPHS